MAGLSFRTSEESLRNAFQSFGQLIEVNLVMDRIANRPRGFAFLRYATKEESEKAIEDNMVDTEQRVDEVIDVMKNDEALCPICMSSLLQVEPWQEDTTTAKVGKRCHDGKAFHLVVILGRGFSRHDIHVVVALWVVRGGDFEGMVSVVEIPAVVGQKGD
ncbi:hypothetical protein R6Q57_011095 [Mikania cordata]